MQAQKESHQAQIKKLPKTKTYVKTWQEFTNRGMQLLVDNPTASRFVLKYIPRTRKFILKVTDDIQFVMKKCKEDELQDIQKFALLAGRALTNEPQKKAEEHTEEKRQGDKKKKNKKKK